ncbi:LysR family transcriptional regulator [Kerstersia gyiorum]|uniref:LysR family transcriptional regulator n=1 Tax=Kerstersia gyiorum TaxID=206506 RepID=A0A4Q7N050_9BURK|nr:LysR family transcriptional regulator [Kerstersia gyiorum]MCP1631697.1 LysR family cyn operon transcriptional activator [Kerstersia gyiorum]MCP1636725.1 LysR family cyn operon transcriptional activator [Kerstersia gyiorum]MCP1671453.1 LysR family cyn operon transcriptional activator [Kerstersia gyiorum]MCP1677414.1 LysR family cyn operon transcriptional activator [Kerstersia gyiorum]MCP1681582.1 LysR family cyn operon transcriptional activator [Kerstersia gyiorum]
MLNLRTVQLFIAVAERLSVSRAATAMHISQSALSRQIQGLEEDLGVRLFERIGKRLALTAEGEDLLPKMSQLLQQANGLSDRIHRLHNGEAGYLSLGATPQTIEALLAPVLRALRRNHSGIEIHLVEGPNERLLDYVESGTVHAAIAWAPHEQKFERLDLFKARLYAVLPPGHAAEGAQELDLTQLGDGPILSLRRGFMTRSMFDQACEDAGLRLNRITESASTQTLWALARSGMGVAVVSSSAVSQWHHKDVVPLTLNGHWVEEVVSAVRNVERYQPLALQAFQAELRNFLRDSPEGSRFRQFATTLL